MPMAHRNRDLCYTAARLCQNNESKTVSVAEVKHVTGVNHAATVLGKHSWFFGLRKIKRGVYGLKRHYCQRCKKYDPEDKRIMFRGYCKDCD